MYNFNKDSFRRSLNDYNGIDVRVNHNVRKNVLTAFLSLGNQNPVTYYIEICVGKRNYDEVDIVLNQEEPETEEPEAKEPKSE